MTVRVTDAAMTRHVRGADAAVMRRQRATHAPSTQHQRGAGAAMPVFEDPRFKERRKRLSNPASEILYCKASQAPRRGPDGDLDGSHWALLD